MKNIILTVPFLLMAIFSSIVSAQQGETQSLAQPFDYAGIQTSPGTFDEINEICWGSSFTFTNSALRENRVLNISFNFHNPQSQPSGGIGTVLSEGTWSLAVFRRNAHVGTVYGSIEKSSILAPDNIDGANYDAKQTVVKLIVKGGSGDYKGTLEGQTGYFEFWSSLRSNQITGSLSLELKSSKKDLPSPMY